MRRRLALVGLGMALLAGCAAGPDTRDVPHPNPPAGYVAAGCPRRATDLPTFGDFSELVGAGDLPTGFVPARTTRCVLNSTYPDGTSALYEVVELHAATVTTALLDSLRLPDQEFTPLSHLACPAIAVTPSYLLLVDDTGRAVIPRLPEGPCGEPRSEVAAAVDGLGLVTTATHRFYAQKQ